MLVGIMGVTETRLVPGARGIKSPMQGLTLFRSSEQLLRSYVTLGWSLTLPKAQFPDENWFCFHVCPGIWLRASNQALMIGISFVPIGTLRDELPRASSLSVARRGMQQQCGESPLQFQG